MLRSGSKGAEGNSQGKKSQTEEIPAFDTLEKFKTGKGGECVSKLFPEVDFQNLNDSTNTAPTSSDNYFGTPPTATSNDVNGCLIIEWKKDEYTVASDTKGKGTFTGIWAFKNGNKGFVNFNVATTKEKQTDLVLKGGFYLLDKPTTGEGAGKGKVTYKKEVTGEDKKLSSSNLDTHFPKSTATSPEQAKDHWGFIQNKESLGKVCANESECTDPPKTTLKKKGTGELTISNPGSTSIKGGCEKLDGWENLYEKNNFDLGNKLESLKGSGTLKDSISN